MRTDKEIMVRIRTIAEQDWMGTQASDLMSRMSFEVAKTLLKDDATDEDWVVLPRDHATIKAEMLDYMPFAWDKANNCRGLSAGRSIDHMSAWLWLLGETDAADQVCDYDCYGKPQLRAICEFYGWDWKQWDDGRWASYETEDGDPRPLQVKGLPFTGAA